MQIVIFFLIYDHGNVLFVYDFFWGCTISQSGNRETDAESTPLRPRTYGDPADAHYHKLFTKT